MILIVFVGSFTKLDVVHCKIDKHYTFIGVKLKQMNKQYTMEISISLCQRVACNTVLY